MLLTESSIALKARCRPRVQISTLAEVIEQKRHSLNSRIYTRGRVRRLRRLRGNKADAFNVRRIKHLKLSVSNRRT